MLDSMGQTALSKSAHKTAQGVEHAHNQVENANAMQDSMGRHVIRSALDSMPLQMKAEATIALVMAAVPTTTAFVMSGGLAGLTRLARSADAREQTII
jgi:CRISPR/Cas system-associated exonuclease Cas4 (RecB family)